MAEEEILEALESDEFLDTLKTGTTDEANAAVKKAFEDKPSIDTTKINITEDATGKRYIERNGNKYPLDKFNTDFNGNLDAIPPTPPDLASALKPFTDDINQKSPDFQKIQNEHVDQFKNTQAYKDRTNLNQTQAQGARLQNDIGSVNSVDDYNQKINDKRLNNLEQKWNDVKANKEGGTWQKVKDFGKFAAIVFGSVELYSFIKQHQDAMNGCWLVNSKTGDKCKILSFTCSADARNSTESTPCALCTNCDSTLAFNNCPGLKCPQVTGDFPGTECSNCCDKSGNNVSCVLNVPTCTDGCDPSCNSSYPSLPPGFNMVCVNASWLQAFTDFLGGIPDDITSGLNTILKWVLMIGGIILACIFLFFVVKFFLGKISRKR